MSLAYYDDLYIFDLITSRCTNTFRIKTENLYILTIHANKWKEKSLLNSSVHLIVAKPQVFIKLDINVYDVCMKRPEDNFSYS